MHKATMKIKHQLGIAFGALLVMVLIVSVLSLRSLDLANQDFTGYVQGIDTQSNLAGDLPFALGLLACLGLALVARRRA